MIDEFCIVRTYSAGVHCGIVREISYTSGGGAVMLTDARRIWQWSEAFTLNEVATNGCGESSRISQPVNKILLLQAIEVIPCTAKAKKNLQRSRNG